MRLLGSKYWWLTVVIAMGMVNLWSILYDGILSEWLLFVWLCNINFFVYSVCNNGKLLIKRVDKPRYNRIIADFHYSINYLKFIGLIIFILSALVDDLYAYIAWYIIALLIIDTMLIVFFRKRVTMDVA
ncbi:MAG TPA: hypothetical protein IAA29_16595 [Candidatus Paenibacillus intestinavium]|nr:hypothetical protein [Candidatus Paenibacillus intestinavium]